MKLDTALNIIPLSQLVLVKLAIEKGRKPTSLGKEITLEQIQEEYNRRGVGFLT